MVLASGWHTNQENGKEWAKTEGGGHRVAEMFAGPTSRFQLNTLRNSNSGVSKRLLKSLIFLESLSKALAVSTNL
jgi:hypothetical protein